MLNTYLSALRLAARWFALLGGLGGPVAFLSQGEWLKAFWCLVTMFLCILILALGIVLVEAFKGT